MKKLFKTGLVFLMVLVLFTSCGKKEESGTASTEKVEEKVNVSLGLVAEIFGTQSFNDDIKDGLETVAAKYDLPFIALEVPEVSDTANSLRTLVSQGVNFIVVGSANHEDSMIEIAQEYPDVKFLYLCDSLVGYENILSTEYAEQDGAFILGALAGLLTKTNNVGSVAAIKGDVVQERFTHGFTAGAKYVNPDITVQNAYTNSYSDINKGQEVASVMYSKGADIVAPFAGACNIGVFNAAKSTPDGVYCFGAAKGQFDQMPSKIVASLVKPVDECVISIISDYIETGKFDTSGVLKLGTANNGVVVKYTTENPELLKLITPEIQAKLDEITADIESGKIVPPSTEAEAKAFKY